MNTFQFFESNIQPLTPWTAEVLKDLEDEHTEHWVIEAMKISAEQGKRNLGYIKAILNRWRADGYGTSPHWERKSKEPAGFQVIREFMADGE